MNVLKYIHILLQQKMAERCFFIYLYVDNLITLEMIVIF